MATNDGIEGACRRLADAIAHAHTVTRTLREMTADWEKYPAWADFMCTELDRLAETADDLISEVTHAARS